MDSKFVHAQFCCSIVAVVVVLACVPLQVRAQAVSLDPAKLPRVGSLDERFASYNIEMVEVTGGQSWPREHYAHQHHVFNYFKSWQCELPVAIARGV